MSLRALRRRFAKMERRVAAMTTAALVFSLLPSDDFPANYDAERGDRVVSVEIDGAVQRPFPDGVAVKRRTLTRAQYAATHNEHRDSAYISGLGGGKTHALCEYVFHRMIVEPRSLHLICCDTTSHGVDYIPDRIDKVARQWGFTPGVDCGWKGRGGHSPQFWMRVNGRTVKCLLRGVKNHGKLRSLECATIVVDEARECDPEGIDVARDRLRCDFADNVYFRLFTTPNGYDAIFDFYDNQEAVEVDRWHVEANGALWPVMVFERTTLVTRERDDGTTHEIQQTTRYVNMDTEANAFVMAGYGDHLASRMDDERLRQEKGGRFLPPPEAVAYKFDRVLDVRAEEVVFDPDADIYFGQDFNVAMNRTVCAQFHDFGNGKELHVFLEITTMDSIETGKTLHKLFGDHRGRLLMFPDPSGKNRKSSDSRVTDHKMLRQHCPRLELTLFRPPSVRDSMNTLNWLFCDPEGVRRIRIHPRCEALVKDLGQVQWASNGKEFDKTNKKLTHSLDGLRYLVWCEYKEVTEVYRANDYRAA